jgi:BirA family biotin operon repressor/biotin-[acetyl-CoA-carboxylase] ligase
VSQGNHSSRWISGSESGLDAWTIEHVAETGSTNDDLMARARSGAPDRLVLVADHQTAGRGRLDRRWESPRGANVLMSMLFRRERTGDPARMTRVVAIAAARAARAISGVDVRLKWPNDLVVGAAKVAGVLAQASPADGCVVVGMGMNVGWAPPEGAALNALAGTTIDRARIVAEICRHVDVVARLSPHELAAEHRRTLDTIGELVRVTFADASECVGTARDVDEDGHLIVDDGTSMRVIDVGDVVHLRRVT